MKRTISQLAYAFLIGSASLTLAGGVSDLYPGTPISESPIPIIPPSDPAAVRNVNAVFGVASPGYPLTALPTDASFGSRRMPSILKATTWMKKMASSTPPASAEALMPQLKAIFASEGVPPELVWIAEVESHFNPSAVSRAGACGLFQFMPTTAERFGLISPAGDQRAEPELSARAAARYLSLLYKRFQNWPLALAAYNAGEGRVGRLLKKHNAASFDEIAAHLPPETQEYVPKIMTTLVLRENTRLSALPSADLSPTLN
jgi:membrane-bound lytic murein transglycosylase D